MLALILAAAVVQPASDPSVEEALQLCRPKLAKEVLGDIGTISANASSVTRGWTVIAGSMTAEMRMGGAPADSARTHHVGRVDYDFVCWVHDKIVMKIRVNPYR